MLYVQKRKRKDFFCTETAAALAMRWIEQCIDFVKYVIRVFNVNLDLDLQAILLLTGHKMSKIE